MPPFEPVHTVLDLHDGRPLQGIAEYGERPVQYFLPFDESRDDYSDIYELRFVDAETLRLSMEDWAIWTRWEAAFRAGQASLDSHPALPADRARHAEIAASLQTRLGSLPGPVVLAAAEFRRPDGKLDDGPLRRMEVRWKPTSG